MSIFKNLIAYRIGTDWTPPDLAALEAELQQGAFTPCGPTQQVSVGWAPARSEDNAAMAESIGGQVILKLAVERKSVPAGALRAEIDRRCKAIEASTGRKPGRKAKLEMKEEITIDFLPRAFSKHSAHFAWIDGANRLLFIGASSYKAADQVVTQIVDTMAALGTVLPITPLSTAMAPSAAMALWLGTKEAPFAFTIDRDLELKATNGDKSVVRYAHHNLELDEICQHITEGKVPTQLALTWEGRVSFVLTEAFVIKKIVTIASDSSASTEDDSFDGDVALITGELSLMLPDLLEALGGETAFGGAPVKPATRS